MQTFPSHLLSGAMVAQASILACAVLGAVDIPPRWLIYLACLSGAIAPDVVMVPLFVWDKINGRQPMANEGRVIYVLKELSHSLHVWLFLLVCVLFLLPAGLLQAISVCFIVSGLIAGVLPDIPTHSEERFQKTDCTFLYPFNGLYKKLFGFSAIRWPNDRLEYRYDHGVLWPLKRWEANFNWLLLALLSVMGIATVFV